MESLDLLFDVLRKERRRHALYVLDEADGPLDVEELAERVSEMETSGSGVSGERHEDVILSLKHTHLPKAARAANVEYDRASNEIRITGEPSEFRIILAVSEALERPDGATPFDPDSMSPGQFLSQLATD